MIKNILAAAAITLAGSSAYAITLDFIGFGSGTYGSSINVSGATVTNTSGGNILVGAGAAGQANGFCSLGIGCQADTEIDFNATVSNLSFWLDGSNLGDSLALTVRGIGDVLLATLNFTVPDQLIDLSSYGSITRLVFDDSSSGAGYGYSRFNFDDAISPIPVPASLPLLLGGIGLIGFMKRRRKS